MMDDETKKDETVEEAPQDQADQPAGPVVEEDSSSSQAAGEEHSNEPTPAGPASEDDSSSSGTAGEEPSSESPAGEADAEGAKEPAAAEAQPAAEEAEPNPEDDLPWKEKRRLEKSRKPHKARPARTVEERAEARTKRRQSKAGMRRKERAAKKAAKTAGTGTPAAERDSVAAKVRQGIVVSNKGEKSITVRIDIARRHPTYEKVVRRSRTLHAHDERNEAGEGDTVRIVETRPLSKTKRWRLVEVLEKAK
jgi:small subunit ribosomal protein S17